jgi:hypothetical protein
MRIVMTWAIDIGEHRQVEGWNMANGLILQSPILQVVQIIIVSNRKLTFRDENESSLSK